MSARALGLAASIAAGCLLGCGDDGGDPQRPGASTGVGTGLPGAPGSTPGQPGQVGSIGGVPGANPGVGGAGANTSGIDLEGKPKYFRVVRLTNAQWAASVQELLKLSSPSSLAENFQSPVTGTTDFSNNEHVLEVNQRAWEDYRNAAEAVADQVTASSTALSAAYSGSDAKGFITTLGRRAYRRPLTAAEITTYTALFDKGSAMAGSKSSFAKGAQLVLRGMLQSPHFLYRTELSPKGAALSGHEVAAKLSLWLRGATPDDALLDSAQKLTSAEAVGAQASTLLEEPRARGVMREFQRELLHFDRYTQISKVNVPAYKEALNAELQETSYLFFDDIFSKGLGVKDVFTSTKGFVGPEMAKLYGLGGSVSGFVQRDLGPARAGYFTQVPYLTLHALNAQPDSIHRGVSMALDVLCAPLGPPATIIPPLPPLMAGQTNRQRVSTLTATCGLSCHNELINPLGFALEHFDGLGQYREQENGGLAIDSSGSFTFSSGPKTFRDAAELMKLLSTEQQTHLCYAKKLASFALQRDMVASDLPWLTKLAATSLSEGGSVKRIMIELAKSDAFRTRFEGAL
jgi:hypothetical protein